MLKKKVLIAATLSVISLSGCGSEETVVPELNVLEKATIVGSSNRNDFDVFRREGGLEITNLWNQFYVETVETTYGDNDILESVTLKLEKKGYAGLYGSIDASYTNVTEKLAATCGTEWKKQHEIEQVYESKNAGYYCKYEYPSSSSSVFVTISKSEQ